MNNLPYLMEVDLFVAFCTFDINLFEIAKSNFCYFLHHTSIVCFGRGREGGTDIWIFRVTRHVQVLCLHIIPLRICSVKAT